MLQATKENATKDVDPIKKKILKDTISALYQNKDNIQLKPDRKLK